MAATSTVRPRADGTTGCPWCGSDPCRGLLDCVEFGPAVRPAPTSYTLSGRLELRRRAQAFAATELLEAALASADGAPTEQAVERFEPRVQPAASAACAALVTAARDFAKSL